MRRSIVCGLFGLLAACGADKPSTTPILDSGAAEAAVQGQCDDNLDCTDGVACTTDACDLITHRCVSTAPDIDNDGHRDAHCLGPNGESLGDDCDDVLTTIGPSQAEVCDLVDNNCNGTVDEGGVCGACTACQDAYVKASNTQSFDAFGGRVALAGDTLVVSARGEGSGASGVNADQADNSAGSSGAVYVFVRSVSGWTQQAYLKSSNPALGDVFGGSIAVAGDTIVVGAYGEDSNAVGINGDQADNSASSSGAAYVFVRNGGTWTQQAYLKAGDSEARREFGRVVAIDGDTIAVGSVDVGMGGSAYVFARSGSTWTQQAYLVGSNTEYGDDFGTSLAVAGDTVVVGASSERSSATGINGDQADNNAVISGAVYVFVRGGSTWTQQAYLKASNTGALDEFGWSVAMANETLVVGARGEGSDALGVDGEQTSNAAADSGAAYVFVRSGSTWSQQAYLKPSNTDARDEFGYSVSVAGDSIVVGAPYEASNATVVNGNQADDSAAYSGAAYVFVRSGSTWIQQDYLKAENAEANDYFGDSVAVSGDTVAVGAPREDSGASGIGGDQADASAENAGAVYVFR